MSEWIVSPAARAVLPRVERALLDATDASNEMRDVARHLILRGGKRLRPALVVVVSELGHAFEDDVVTAAVIVELMHVASLYHDDVIDRAPLRRGAASINKRWGNPLATVAGTFLIARALDRAASLGDDVNAMTTESVAALCSGELQEIENAFDAQLSEATHLEVLARKTASLFRLPCALAAHLSHAGGETSRALDDYALHVGLAFQIADDALDLVARTRVLGKHAGTDLREGIYSLAVLRVLSAGGDAAARLRDLLARESPSQRELQTALAIIRKSGAVDSALATAREHVSLGRASLQSLPRGAAVESLDRFATMAVERAA